MGTVTTCLKTFATCTVTLTDNKEVYRRGEKMTGTVVLDVTRNVAVEDVGVCLYGESHVVWTEQDSELSVETRKSNKEMYFQVSATVSWKSENNNGTEQILQPGRYKYDFRSVIPDRELPPSYEGQFGSTRYWIKVTVKTPFDQRDWHWHKNFTLLTDIDVNGRACTPLIQSTETKEEGYRNPGFEGCMTLTSAIDRGDYCPGEKIALSVVARNDSNKDCLWLRAQLVQMVMFTANNETKTNYCVISEVKESPFLKGERIVWIEQMLDIDAVPPSTPPGYSNSIVVSYYLKVLIEGHCWNRFPIIVGAIPQQSSSPFQVTACRLGFKENHISIGNLIDSPYAPLCTYVTDYIYMPIHPLLPPEVVPTSPPPSPRMRQESDLPPSYEDAMKMDKRTTIRLATYGGRTLTKTLPSYATPMELPPSYEEYMRFYNQEVRAGEN